MRQAKPQIQLIGQCRTGFQIVERFAQCASRKIHLCSLDLPHAGARSAGATVAKQHCRARLRDGGAKLAARDINDGQLLIEPLDGRNIQTTLPGEHNCWKKAPSKEIQLPPREDWRGCTNSVEERLDVNAPR
jgi:hypothetical protein